LLAFGHIRNDDAVPAIETQACMKPDILYIGRFPEPTVDELHRRFTVHNWLMQPKPEEIDPTLRARVRAAAVEVNRGANRTLIESLRSSKSSPALVRASTSSMSPPRVNAASR
jgi:hypothetical protein